MSQGSGTDAARPSGTTGGHSHGAGCSGGTCRHDGEHVGDLQNFLRLDGFGEVGRVGHLSNALLSGADQSSRWMSRFLSSSIN